MRLTRTSVRTVAAAASLVAMIAGTAVGCGSEIKDTPTETQTPSTPGSSAPQSPGSPSAKPTEKVINPTGPNSFTPPVKAPAPTPQAPKPCLPFCE